MKKIIISAGVVASMLLASCSDEIEMRRPPVYELPELPIVEGIHQYKAPLYWSVYEYCYTREQAGVANSDMDITPEQWDEIIDWVATELKPHGYDMVCTDGFIPMLANDASGYMTHYGSTSLKDLVAKAKAKGLKVGVYDNPLWIHGPAETKIEGTDYTFGGLYYNGTTEILNPSAENMWFNWVVAENPGAREYIDGFFKHYAELGIDYIRMDFLSWYEDGKDRNIGVVGHGYGRASYGRAMAYIAESAKKYGIFTSLVMPHMYNDAEVEARYGNMVRIVADTAGGGWWHCSSADKGRLYANWPNCMNMFDGFTYWSHIAGRNRVILDGDFIRLNTFDTDAEKETVVSLQLMAGGPVTVADQISTIGNDMHFYTNDEMLALNADGFVGHPLSSSLTDQNNQIWFGQMSNGDYVVGLFNRGDNSIAYNINFADLGIAGEWKIRDLWRHADEGTAASISATVAPHGCKIVRLSK
ncbi:MAG: glucan 1,6-alpha-isomaltosidase [Muribaculaceae bacterium]|nr:glucan 1,6-alpha-isomaltosidase [Muribaculaceae bacterium]